MTEIQQWHHALKDTEQLRAQGIKSLPHVLLEGFSKGAKMYCITDRRQCPVVFRQVYTINCHLQLHIWLLVHFKT